VDIKTYNRIFKDDREFPLNVRFTDQDAAELHRHEFTELVIILHGCGRHLTKFAAAPIAAGDVLVIPRGGSHGYDQVRELRLMNVLFAPDQLPMPLLDFYRLPGFSALFALKNEFCEQHRFYPSFTLPADTMVTVTHLLRFMEDECRRMQPGHRLCMMGYFMSLLGNLARAYNETLPAPTRVPGNIARAISFMKNNFDSPLTLPEITRVAGMSKSAFMRNFRQATGSTPIDYLIRTRILEACARLRSSGDRISEISAQVGFADSDYFSRVFRQVTGQSPRQYRRSHAE